MHFDMADDEQSMKVQTGGVYRVHLVSSMGKFTESL